MFNRLAKLWWGVYWWVKYEIFLAAVGDLHSPLGKNLAYTLKNDNLPFLKTFWVSIRNNKKDLVINIKKYTLEYKLPQKLLSEHFSEHLSVMFEQFVITWTKFKRLSFYCFFILKRRLNHVFIIIFRSSHRRCSIKKGALKNSPNFAANTKWI